jgi:hypothetical protein
VFVPGNLFQLSLSKHSTLARKSVIHGQIFFITPGPGYMFLHCRIECYKRKVTYAVIAALFGIVVAVAVVVW